MNTTAPLLEVKGVTLQYKTPDHLVTATYRVDFQVFQADRFILLGPSGCGKSTLLKAVGGYMVPTEGEIRLKGNLINTGAGSHDGVSGIRPVAAVEDSKAERDVPARILQPQSAARGGRPRDAYIDKVNLAKFADTYPHTLSGGMKQRVAIARGMAMEPDVLLMDEPFAALDALTRRKMQDELLELWDETRFTVLFVTHSIPEAIKIGTRILLLSPHPGQVKAELNSGAHIQDAIELEQRIQHMLFADQIEEAEND